MLKKVLLICYYFPPMGGGGVGRPLSLFKYLKEHDIECHVLTVKPSTFRVYDKELVDADDEYRIYRAGSFDPQRILHLLGLRNMSLKAIGSGQKLSSRFFPDSKVGWVRSAVRLGRQLISAHGYDCIVSTSPPVSAHLVAEKLSKETKIAWIADFRDYWTSYPIEQTYSDLKQVERANLLLENINKKVTVVTTVNDLVAEYVGTKQVICNSFDRESLDEWDQADNDKFVIGLFGSFNEISPVKPLFELLKNLKAKQPEFFNRVKLLQVGDTNQEWFESELKNFDLEIEYELLGFVNRTEAIKKISASSCFFLSLSKEMPDGISTGRLFYLLSSRRPIVAYCNAKSEMARLVNSTGISCQFDNPQDKKPFEYLSGLIERQIKGEQLPLASLESIDQYSSDKMVLSFASLIKSL